MSFLRMSFLAAAVAASSSASGDPRGLCARCRGMMFITSVGTCAECGKGSSSGGHKLCKACSGRLRQCVHCRADLASGKPAPGASSQAPLTVDESVHGKTVALIVGQRLAVQLAGNATTGYRWDLTRIEGKAVVRDGDLTYQADHRKRPLVGGGGRFTCFLLAKSPGTVKIELHYRRSWESAVKPLKRVAFTVEVTNAKEKK
ncbi:MAG: protease inhibitor I42 family protein [Lentisphaerae bacterium]|jgi:predicted secreted protein|nr:protease inhibitor I42 family protein [Lentisphaerota bacterium]MBT4815197.1 protease inhibitor I42 family protein [Lentisphaerota bacterium]MBT5607016.1 protease inhibitor I42 family protein [Lentisphaerota bacterium]MBT7059717.1 protease inhibitor I42 family protein [Lentisphaerota bacterium]MBT7843294.1 protease inhibitor I42 family protein [Lentisphaerota bacterium]